MLLSFYFRVDNAYILSLFLRLICAWCQVLNLIWGAISRHFCRKLGQIYCWVGLISLNMCRFNSFGYHSERSYFLLHYIFLTTLYYCGRWHLLFTQFRTTYSAAYITVFFEGKRVAPHVNIRVSLLTSLQHLWNSTNPKSITLHHGSAWCVTALEGSWIESRRSQGSLLRAGLLVDEFPVMRSLLFAILGGWVAWLVRRQTIWLISFQNRFLGV